MPLQQSFIKHISAPENPSGIESAFQPRHLAQMCVAVELNQVFSFQLSDSVFGGNCAANFDGMMNESTVNLPSLRGFIVISRQDVYMHVVVADMSEDRVTQIPAAQQVLV